MQEWINGDDATELIVGFPANKLEDGPSLLLKAEGPMGVDELVVVVPVELQELAAIERCANIYR
ncbi:MAG: hypothetical protein AB7N65_04760 [Vicinamibacterales bacterium]